MSAFSVLAHAQRKRAAERLRLGRLIGRAVGSRNGAISSASVMAMLTLVFAGIDFSMLATFFAMGMAVFFVLLALRDHHRADALFARGVAAALAESGVDFSDLAEAA